MKPLSMKTIAGLCAAASVLTISAGAFAQNGPPRLHTNDSGRPMADRMAMMQERGAEHSKRLHAILQITPGQEPAFQAWQAALKPAARPGQRPNRPGPGAAPRAAQEKLTTPQRLDRQLARLDERQSHVRARAEATKRFYNQLSPSQKTAMDNLPPRMLAMGGPRGGRGMGGPGMRGPGGRGHGEGGQMRGRRGPGGPGGFHQDHSPAPKAQ